VADGAAADGSAADAAATTDRAVRAPLAAPPADLPPPVPLADADWPQFRGPDRNGTSRERRLLRQWPAGGPARLWETAVGEGYAAPSAAAGRVYLNDYDAARQEWLVRCLQLDTGAPIWRYATPKRIRPNHAITRTAPTTDGAFVFAMDPKCELHCLDARDGRLLWRLSLPEAFGTPIPPWYNGQSPLATDDAVVVATGGRRLLAALDKATGRTLWETPNPDGAPLSHASIMPATIDGVAQYVYLSLSGVYGVAADDGRLLWQLPWKFNVAVPTSATILPGGQIFITSCYQAPTGVCQVALRNGVWTAEEVRRLPPGGWNSEVHTPIVYGGRLYGVGKKQRGLWTCLDLRGEVLWTSAGQASFDLGGYLLADDLFFVLEGKTGVLRLLDAKADRYVELASAAVVQGPEAWAPPVLSQGKLLVRDLHRLACLQVAQTHRAADASHEEPPR
jgi:outer membrane protein assembly factor BamB